MNESLITDVAIIGAGPVGLFAVFELGMLKISSVLIDALGEAGGQCAALYPEKPIYDIPAHPSIAAGELVARLEHQIAPFAAPRLLGRRVERLAGGAGAFAIGTDQGDEIRAKAVLIAAGAGAFGPNRPPIPGLPAYEATGAVQYYVRRREDFRGKRVVIAGELVARLEHQIAPFAAPRLLGRRVERLAGGAGAFAIGTDQGDEIRAKAVLIAAGAGAFGPNRPPIPGLPAYEATGAVQYYVRRREDFRGKRVVIAGGGDSAADWALALKDIARVAVVHRRPKFRAAPETAARIEAAAERGEIEMVIPYQLAALHGADGILTEVEVATLKGEPRRLPADALLAFFGLSMDLGPIAGWGIELEMHHVRIDPATCQTSVPGVFAIGDVASYPGKLKLILQGFSEAAMAAHAIHPIAHPGQALHFEYSTTKGIPATPT